MDNPPQDPLIFATNAESISRTGREVCHELRQVVDKLVSTVTPENATFDNVLGVLLRHENEIQLTSNVLSVYALVATDAALRNAAAEAIDKISHCLIDRKANKDLFRLIDAAYQRQNEDDKLDTESRKAIAEERRSYIRNGMGLDDDIARYSVADIARRLKTIETEFMKNLDEKEHFIWLSRQELAGIPEDALSGLEVGAGKVDGQLKLDLNGPEVRWMLSQASSPATRERLYLETRRVARENVALFDEAIRLRHGSAQLLGYSSHIAYKVEVMMAKTPEAVIDLLESVRDRVIRRLPGDIQKLLELKRGDPNAQGRTGCDVLLWSDIPYYSRIFEEQNYSLDHSLISEYFPLHQTVSKMLTLFGKLLGFVFVELTNTSSKPSALEQGLIWHQDVLLYSVWNDEQEGGDFIGYLYLDLYPRTGKAGGAQCRPLQLGFERPDGRRHCPSTVLLTNFRKSAPGKPSLLQHSEVVLLFHELGHGMHDLAGRCKYSRFHGAETVSDFNEAPSQMLENWCWDATALKYLSGHYRTGNPLPDSMITSLLRTRVVLPAVKLMPQLKMTLFDAIVHSAASSDDSSVDLAKIYTDCNEFGGIKSPGAEFGYASYRHLFSGSDGTIYNYLWSKVLAMDMFDAFFKQDPLNDKAGRRYRHLVLEKGGCQDEMETFVQFIGRKPTSEAFYESLGLD
ncbi:peptidase family M3 [Hypoxylon sp. EC38]|nr:peptidase family M3 [Hypoxylon sp. EC38]